MQEEDDVLFLEPKIKSHNIIMSQIMEELEV